MRHLCRHADADGVGTLLDCQHDLANDVVSERANHATAQN